MLSNSENKSSETEESKKIQSYYEQYSESAYHFFSSFLYARLPKIKSYLSMPEMKSSDPFLGQASLACRHDGTGIHHIVANAAKLALSKEEYGGACYWYFGPENTKYSRFAMLMIDPNDIEWLFKSKVIDNFDAVGSFDKFLGNNNIFSLKLGSKEWRDERNRHLQVLDDKVIGKDLPDMKKVWDDYLEKMEFDDGKATISNLEKFASDYTLDVVAKTKLGVNLLSEETKNEISDVITKISIKLADQTESFMKSILPFLDYFPFHYFFNQEFKKLMKMGDEILKNQVIKPNRETILTQDNFITKGRDRTKIDFDSSDIINQFKEFLVVGHETTAKLLLFTLMLLSDEKHISILEKLRAEIREFKNGDPREFAKEDFDQMTFLNAILHETLRLYPPVPIMVNNIDIPCRFRDIELQKGDLVFISQRQTHRYKPAWGNDAEEFNPSRFIDDNGKIKEFKDYMYFPFGFYPRRCIGQKFAMLEVKQLVSIIATEYDIALAKEMHHPFPVESTFTMKVMLENIPLYFSKRENMNSTFSMPHSMV